MRDVSECDAIVVGAGLAGLVAATELAAAGKSVVIIDQEGEQNLGGQAYWSFGGLFLVDSPEQRRLRIRDSFDLAWQDWLGAAGFDRDEDHWPRRWAEAYVAFAAGEKRAWLHQMINRDRMWHYVEGVRNWNPVWANHGIRILPGPSSMWFDAIGNRLPAPNFPGYDTLGTLSHLRRTGYDYSWFILTQSIVRKEFALSGSEQNPDLTGRDWMLTARRAIGKRATAPVEAFKEKGEDFTIGTTLKELVAKMNKLVGSELLDLSNVEREIVARDREIANPFGKDAQIMGIRNARQFLGDGLIRTAPIHRILDPAHGPLIAVRLNIITRKTLGGLETDLSGRVFGADRQIIPGLYAVGEVAGFGGGGMHGYRSLEGTFLGGCLFSGRTAGRAAAAAL